MIYGVPDDPMLAELVREYGGYGADAARAPLRPSRVPPALGRHLTLARFWGLEDPVLRDELVEKAPPGVRDALRRSVMAVEDELLEWLAGPESASEAPTAEYLAFSGLLRASDMALAIAEARAGE